MKFLSFNTKKIAAFKNNNDLFDYISEIENSKLLEDHPDFGHSNWSFIIFPPKTCFYAAPYNRKQSSTGTLRKAYENEHPLIEICKGNYENPIQIPVTPDLDIEELKKS